jgi:hypothetical protein
MSDLMPEEVSGMVNAMKCSERVPRVMKSQSAVVPSTPTTV